MLPLPEMTIGFSKTLVRQESKVSLTLDTRNSLIIITTVFGFIAPTITPFGFGLPLPSSSRSESVNCGGEQ